MPIYKNIYLVFVDKMFNKNRVFELKNPDNYSDRLYKENTYPYFLLKQELDKNNISLNTYDFFDEKKEPYALIFIDVPANLGYFLKKHKNADKFLIIYESPIISLRNLNIRNHLHFKKIFTWQTNLVDNKKYFKLNYANTIPKNTVFDLNRKNLCTIISGNTFTSHPLELYSERIRAIRWFEKNHPDDFDFYGKGWDKHYFKNNFLHLNRLVFLAKIFKPNYPSYKGPAKSKQEIYGKYKFAICFENASFPDYISEKIFDCFFSGCIPIYLGSPNIKDYIPANTFIDMQKFKSYEDLYKYIKNMPEMEYKKYLSAIEKFIKSEKIYPFSAECFSKTISSEIIK